MTASFIPSLLKELDDITITTPAVGHGIRYDGSKWVNQQLSHLDLTNAGTNTHAQIDTHIAGATNPHGTTLTQTNLNVGSGAISDPSVASMVVFGGVKTQADIEATKFNFFPYGGDWRIYLRSKIQVDEEMQFGTTGIWKAGSFVGIGTITPTAVLHLKAGTASANTAPLKFMAGTNLTTPENGAFEYDGTNLYFTIGGVRKTVSLI